MEPCRITVQDHASGLPVIQVTGYLAKEGGTALLACIKGLLAAGRKKLLIDFAACSLVSSPGVAALLECLCLTQEDHRGTCVLVNLDEPKRRFLTMTGILPLAPEAPSVEEALALAGVKA